MPHTRPYDPLTDAHAVLELWHATLGAIYPLAPRVFHACTTGRPTYTPDDALVLEDDGRLVGFAMMECDGTPGAPRSQASVLTILIHPAHQRRGLGSTLLNALHRRARTLGFENICAGQTAGRLWTGVPDDLPHAVAFFRRHGYTLTPGTWDLITPLENYASRLRYQHRLVDAGATVRSATDDDLGDLFAFQAREFPQWLPSMLRIAAAGDIANLLLVQRDSAVIGSIQTHTPASRWRSPNLVWERIHGERMGGYGAVGIGKTSRGLGLGAAMCEAAALHVARCGASCALIDYTNLVDFYAKVGAQPWRMFHLGAKTL